MSACLETQVSARKEEDRRPKCGWHANYVNEVLPLGYDVACIVCVGGILLASTPKFSRDMSRYVDEGNNGSKNMKRMNERENNECNLKDNK